MGINRPHAFKNLSLKVALNYRHNSQNPKREDKDRKRKSEI